MQQDEARCRMLRALAVLGQGQQDGGGERPAEGKAAGTPASPWAALPSSPFGSEPLGDPTEAARADLFAEMVDRQRQATSRSIEQLLGGVLRSYRVK